MAMLAEAGNGRLFSIDDAASIGELQIRFGVAQHVNQLPVARFRSESDEELTSAVVNELTTERLCVPLRALTSKFRSRTPAALSLSVVSKDL